ncbi:MAG TPA: hypothetical protein VFW78_10045 [Bacteroidia bacterium]|nr:hypothetical protein [Bacteroidia bacterium]
MKKLHLFPFGIVLLALVFLIQGCAKDDTGDPSIPGSDRDKYVGNWLCKETYSGSTPNTFTINIQKHGDLDTLYVYNFNNLGSQYYTIWLISGNSVTIPNQDVSPTQVTISGSGFYNSSKINLTYTSDGDNVNAECTRP